jgi:ankyrin repeat protein
MAIHNLAMTAGTIAFLAVTAGEFTERPGVTPKAELLHNAIQAGDLQSLEALLDDGGDLSARNDEGMPLLHHALREGHKEIARLLLRRGSDANQRDRWTFAPLNYAVMSPDWDLVELLLAKGADANYCPDGIYPPIYYAVWHENLHGVELLVANGARFDTAVRGGLRVVHVAASQGSRPIVNFFLGQGVHIPALHRSACTGNLRSLKALLDEGVGVDEKDAAGWTALYWAVSMGQVEVAELLLDRGAQVDTRAVDERTPLHQAASAGNSRLVEVLLAMGADVNAEDKRGNTPLHEAAFTEHPQVAALLLTKGAAVNARNAQQATPLHAAMMRGNVEATAVLLDDGADMTAQNSRSWTPLDRAVQGDHDEAVNLAVKRELESTNPPDPLHDVSISAVTAPEACIRGERVSFTIRVANQGTFRESFSVKVREQATGETVATRTITLGKRWHGKADDIPDLVFRPETTATNLLGNRVCLGGDVNGDGFRDVLLGGALSQDWRGQARVYFGGSTLDTQPAILFTGENPGDRLSDQSGAFGDLNQDGYDDLIIGAPFHPRFEGDGRVYVFYGGPDLDDVPDMVFEGPADEGSWFGLMVAASDIDADGHVDLLVGAQNHDHGGEYGRFQTREYGPLNGRGRVYLYWGGNPMGTKPGVIFEGEQRGDWFGRRIAAGEDVNADGYKDILIGARHAGGRENRGAAYLFLGSRKQSMDAKVDWIIRGEGQDHQMGSSVAMFDVDADGYDDVLVGARGAVGFHGRVYVYWGAKAFEGSPPGLILEAPTTSSMGGDTISCAHFNRDQYGDILVGAFGYPGSGYMFGRAYLFYGNARAAIDADLDYIFGGEDGNNDFFGCQLAAGDVNNDGFADALIGAEGARQDMGAAYLYFGPFHDSTEFTVDWDSAGASVGEHVFEVEIPSVPGEHKAQDNRRTFCIQVGTS